MKTFLATFLLTALFFSIAGYAKKRALIANPEVLNQVAKHFNFNIKNADGFFYINNAEDVNYEKSEKAWEFDGSKENLIISTVGADLTIENSVDDRYHVLAQGLIDKSKEDDLFDVEAHDRDIFISDSGKRTKSVKLKIQVPENKLRSLQANSISGDILIQAVHFEQVHLMTVSGDAHLKGVFVKSIETKSTSGDVDIDNRLEANIDSKSVSGDIKIKSYGLAKSSFSLRSISGNVVNPFKNQPDAATKVMANSVSGNIVIRED